jgi:hypothetical protein
MGNIIGDVTINGSMVGGRIAARDSIFGNVTILGTMDSSSAIVSGGSIGSGTLGTKLSSSGNILGIVAAVGPITAGTLGTTGTTSARFYQQMDAADAAVIDEIFTQGISPLSAADIFDRNVVGDLLNLDQMMINLSELTVTGNTLAL